MKMMFYFVLNIFLIAIFSCDKQKTPEPQESKYWGSSTSDTNEGKWTSTSIGASEFLYPGFELTLYREVNSNILEEIFLRRIALRLGKHYITANSSVNDSLTGITHSYLEQLDQLYSMYIPESDYNYIELKKYDSITHIIEGKLAIILLTGLCICVRRITFYQMINGCYQMCTTFN